MRALLVVPLPCDARTCFGLVGRVAALWERDHPGRTMMMSHMETVETEQFGRSLVVWDEPVTEDGSRVPG